MSSGKKKEAAKTMNIDTGREIIVVAMLTFFAKAALAASVPKIPTNAVPPIKPYCEPVSAPKSFLSHGMVTQSHTCASNIIQRFVSQKPASATDFFIKIASKSEKIIPSTV